MGLIKPPKIRMVLRVNRKLSATIFEDEPLIISISLVNNQASNASSVNSYYKNQLESITKKHEEGKMPSEDYQIKSAELKQKLVEVKSFSFGGPGGWPKFISILAKNKGDWSRTDWPWHLLLNHPDNEVLTLNGRNLGYVEYGLDPEDNGKPKGGFLLKVLLEISEKKYIESNTCSVNFLQKKMSKIDKEKEDALINLGRYAYKKKLFEDSMNYAEEVLRSNKDSIEGWTLKGEIEESKGYFDKAEYAYSQAIEAFNKKMSDSPEPPEALYTKLTRVKSKIPT